MRTIHAVRLKPGQDLKLSIEQYARDKNIRAGWIITCVGSLTQYTLRFANEAKGKQAKGFFEIISLSGTLGINGCHFHIAISDRQGILTGGHLLEGCIIYTTAEVIIEETTEYILREKTTVVHNGKNYL